MATNDTEDMSRYDEMLAEVQALYDAGRDQKASVPISFWARWSGRD